jgi:hypothetical protein
VTTKRGLGWLGAIEGHDGAGMGPGKVSRVPSGGTYPAGLSGMRQREGVLEGRWTNCSPSDRSQTPVQVPPLWGRRPPRAKGAGGSDKLCNQSIMTYGNSFALESGIPVLFTVINQIDETHCDTEYT